MMADTKIEWCDKVWNPVVGCTKCSPGCLNCYAERMALRLSAIELSRTAMQRMKLASPYHIVTDNKGWNGKIATVPSRLEEPLHWREPKRIFVCSMSDLFHPKVPFEFIEKIWDVMLDCMNIHNNPVWLHRQSHTFQILTKRIDRALEFSKWMLKKHRRIDYSNVHLGVSISTQDEMWKAEELSRIPAAVRYISFEPLLEDITNINTEVMEKIDGAIIGCESGPRRRDFDNRWALGLVADFHHFNKPVFVKQINVNGKVVKMPERYPQELPERR